MLLLISVLSLHLQTRGPLKSATKLETSWFLSSLPAFVLLHFKTSCAGFEMNSGYFFVYQSECNEESCQIFSVRKYSMFTFITGVGCICFELFGGRNFKK